MEKTDFDDKLKNLNKKVTCNKAKHVVAEYTLTKKVAEILEKGYDFLVFAPMLCSLSLDKTLITGYQSPEYHLKN